MWTSFIVPSVQKRAVDSAVTLEILALENKSFYKMLQELMSSMSSYEFWVWRKNKTTDKTRNIFCATMFPKGFWVLTAASQAKQQASY